MAGGEWCSLTLVVGCAGAITGRLEHQTAQVRHQGRQDVLVGGNLAAW